MPILTAEERLGSVVATRYRFDRVLAVGGMSVVFEGTDLRTNRSVAIKILKPQDCTDPTKISRFLLERRLAVELRHPNIVDIRDYGEDQTGMPYLVMERLEGESLGALLRRRGTLSAGEVLEVALPVMAALGTVHGCGVVHRDVKPDNIFLSLDTRGHAVPKVLDFGIAKPECGTFATRTGAVLGTPEYIAPEQLAGLSVTPATDIWAMAAVIYRCLCGAAPFSAASAAEIIARATRDPPPLLRAGDLSPAFCAVIDRALARDPADRFASMQEFARALSLAAQDAGIAPVRGRPALARVTLSHADSSSAVSRTVSMPSGPLRRVASRPAWRSKVAVFAALALGAWFFQSMVWAPATPVAPSTTGIAQVAEAPAEPPLEGVAAATARTRSERSSTSVQVSTEPAKKAEASPSGDVEPPHPAPPRRQASAPKALDEHAGAPEAPRVPNAAPPDRERTDREGAVSTEPRKSSLSLPVATEW